MVGEESLCVQSDSGFEFTNCFSNSKKEKPPRFEQTAARLNICHKLIRLYTPEHNIKAERSHREERKRFYNIRRFYFLHDFGGLESRSPSNEIRS